MLLSKNMVCTLKRGSLWVLGFLSSGHVSDPILKERLYGVSGPDGNHGEDVKEYYFYLDSTPTHSYMKMLYKYPHAAFPYSDLLEESQRRGPNESEYELIDTGVFDESRYFDVEVEYAKADKEDILIRITVSNRGPDKAPLHLLPTIWFRNTWSWGYPEGPMHDVPHKPRLAMIDGPAVYSNGCPGLKICVRAATRRFSACPNNSVEARL